MQSIMLDFIRRCSFVYLVIILAIAFDPALAEGSSAESQSGFFSAHDGVPIHYSAFGAGLPALLFVHGWSCDQSYWKEQVTLFSRDFRVVTVDLAGHGKSGMGRKEWSIGSFGGDVSAVVKGLDLKNVILIGHSMGSPVILDAARQLPGRVRGLVLVDSYRDFETWSTTEENEEWLIPFRANFVEKTRTFVRGMFQEDADQTLVEQIVADMSAAPPEVALGALESAIMVMYGPKITTALQGLDVPVIVINSDLGSTNVESMERDGVEVHIVSGTGHFLMMEDPHAFNSVLSKVIESLAD